MTKKREFKLLELKLKPQQSSVRKIETVATFDNAASIFHNLLDDSPTEKVYELLVNSRNQLLGIVQIAMGGIFGAAMTPRDVLVPALIGNANGIILGHNHPSGDPLSSSEDIQMTVSLTQACELVGLVMLDHVVVARDGAASVFDYLKKAA